jgi:hypothetical protein
MSTRILSGLLISFFVLFLLSVVSFADTEFEKLDRYSGSKLTTATFICKSARLAAAGFWRDWRANSIDKGVTVSTEAETTIWRITVGNDMAEVIRYTGATQEVENPKRFSAESASGGLLLIAKDRTSGESPEIITIDMSNSSFVYSSQHVNPLWNRANVFIGSCMPD